MDKYELTDITIRHRAPDGRMVTLRRIRLPGGPLGGFVENRHNLSEYGSCWVHDDAKVFDGAVLEDDAQASGESQVCGGASVGNASRVSDQALVNGGELSDECVVKDRGRVLGGLVYDRAVVQDRGVVCGIVGGDVRVVGDGRVTGDGVYTGEGTIDGVLDHDRDEEEISALPPNPMPAWVQDEANTAAVLEFIRACGGHSHAIVPGETFPMVPAEVMAHYHAVHRAPMGQGKNSLYGPDGNQVPQVEGVDIAHLVEAMASHLGVHSTKMGRNFRFQELRAGIAEIMESRDPTAATVAGD